MTRLTAWAIGLAMGALTTWALVLGWVNRERDKATATATEARVAYVRDSTAWATVRRESDARQRADSLERVTLLNRAAEQEKAAARSRATTTQLSAQLAVAATTADSVPILITIVAQQDTTIHHLSNQADNLANALQSEIRRSAELTLSLAAADSGLAAAQRRIQVLDGLVRTPPNVPRGRLFGFLPKPKCGVGVAVTVGPDAGIAPRPAVACVVGL